MDSFHAIQLFPIFLVGIVVYVGILELAHIFLGWPTRTPNRAALLSNGIAWQNDGRIQFLARPQVQRLDVRNVFLVIEANNGRKIKFHVVLSTQPTDYGVTNELAQDNVVVIQDVCGFAGRSRNFTKKPSS